MLTIDSNHHTGRTKRRGKPFRLLSHFTVTAILSISIASVLLGLVYQNFSRSQLAQGEERHHEEVSELLAELIWPRYGQFLLAISDQSIEQDVDSLSYQELHTLVGRHISASRILKLKIFNSDGLTVYSSDPGEIGQMKTGHSGFESARSGQVKTVLSFRESSNPDEHQAQLQNRHVVCSYVPITSGPDNANVVAVFEVSSDVTNLVSGIKVNRNLLVSTILAIMSVLFIILFMNVLRADRVLKKQAADQRQTERQATWQANHDALTLLPNRRYFNALLQEKLSDTNETWALLFIDLDGFKPINDGYGHQAGDDILRQIAARIRSALPDAAIVARLGGDEFTALVPVENNLAGRSIDFHVDALQCAIGQPVSIESKDFTLSASIGVTFCDNTQKDSEALIAEADMAMYQAKKSGRKQARVYSTQLGDSVINKLNLEQELRIALEQGELEVFYQPRVAVEPDVALSVEALARWTRANGESISPLEFVPLAEETGLYSTLDLYVLEKACKDMISLDVEGYTRLALSVNFSARHFDRPGFVDDVFSILNSTGFSAERLQIELTESVLVDHNATCSQIFSRLRASGIKILIDDFGTGYSSLGYLRQMSIDGLKVDRSFIKELNDKDAGNAMVSTIVQLANSLNLFTVAEGVETAEQLAAVTSCGVDEIQGYLFARPGNMASLRTFLAQTASDNVIPLKVVNGNG